RNKRRDIPRLQHALDNEIDVTHCEQGIAVTIPAEIAHARLPADVAEGPPVVLVEERPGMRGRYDSLRKRGTFPRAQRLAPIRRDEFGFALEPDEAFAKNRLVDDAENALAVFLQRDQRSPGMAPGDEGARAVHRVEHPGQPRRAGLVSVLLAENRIVGPFGIDDHANRLLRPLVGSGDGIEHRHATHRPFVVDGDTLAEIGTDHLTRPVGKLVGELDGGGIEWHGTYLARLSRLFTSPLWGGRKIEAQRKFFVW